MSNQRGNGGGPRVFELHSPLSAEEFRSLRSKRCSAYARRQTATGQTTGRMRTPKHGGRRRRRAKAGRATTRHDGGPGANPALHKVPNMSPASWRGGRRNMWRYIPAPGAEAEAQSPEAQASHRRSKGPSGPLFERARRFVRLESSLCNRLDVRQVQMPTGGAGGRSGGSGGGRGAGR